MAYAVPSFATLRARAQTAIQSVAAHLTDFRRGSSLWAVANAGATLADNVIGVAIDRAAAAYIGTATGADLDRRITDYGGPARLPDSAATMSLTITADDGVGGFVAGFTIDEDAEATGTAPDGNPITFVADSEVVVALGDLTATIPVTCSEVGTRGNIGPEVVLTLDGTPADGTVTHGRASGGALEELDPAYRLRARLEFRSLVRATVLALLAAARRVAGVVTASVDESKRAASDGGYVSVYVADSSGTAGATLLAAAQAEIELTRAAGVEVLAAAGTRQEIAFALTVYRTSQFAGTAADIKAAWIQYLDTLASGESHYAGAGEADVKAIDDAGIWAVKQTTPAAEVTAPSSASAAIRTAADGSQITVTFVDVA